VSPPPLPPEVFSLVDEPATSGQSSLTELLAEYFGHDPAELETLFRFDSLGNVSIAYRGQPQFFAACGLFKKTCVSCDTGAEQSFISWDALARIQGVSHWSQTRYWPTKNTAIDASGNRMKLVGLASIQLEIQGKKTAPIPVYIVPQANFEVLLGQNWSKDAVQADLLLSWNLIVFNKGPLEGHVASLLYRKADSSIRPGVYLMHKVTVSACKQMMVKCRPSKALVGDTLLVESSQVLPGVMVPRVLVKKQTIIQVNIFNTNMQPIHLRSSQCVALAESIQEETIDTTQYGIGHNIPT